jgi:hypothetical protein
MTKKKYDHEPVEEFVFEDWLRDGFKGFRQKIEGHMSGEGKDFDTSEFRRHIFNAQKEHLLAVRSLLDSAIDWLDQKEKNTEQQA